MLLIEPEEQPEHGNREQTAPDAEQSARRTDQGTENEPENDLELVEVYQRFNLLLVSWQQYRCYGTLTSSSLQDPHRMSQTHIRDTPVEPGHSAPAGEPLSSFCPRFHYAVELVGRRWIGAIVRVLMNGPHRFNELLAAVPGLSDRLLTERLRELEREGIVTRTVHDERPVRVTYALTESGASLDPILRQISDWAERWVDLQPAKADPEPTA